MLLGVGGRVAMRIIALAQGTPAGFSLGGSATVVFLGTLSGIAAGLIYAACRQLSKTRVWLARFMFGAVLLAITLRGLRPLDTARLVIFLPLFVIFAFAMDWMWERGTFSTFQPVQSDPRRAA
jgi:hypothetical protein